MEISRVLPCCESRARSAGTRTMIGKDKSYLRATRRSVIPSSSHSGSRYLGLPALPSKSSFDWIYPTLTPSIQQQEPICALFLGSDQYFLDSHTSHNENGADENSAGLPRPGLGLIYGPCNCHGPSCKICYNARIGLVIENRGFYFFRPARTAQNASQNASPATGQGENGKAWQPLAALATPRG